MKDACLVQLAIRVSGEIVFGLYVFKLDRVQVSLDNFWSGSGWVRDSHL